ncbi:hypothetical protein GCM10008931_20340 [Oceanobacillus oncorhynchi subsp. oncorhynchi]
MTLLVITAKADAYLKVDGKWGNAVTRSLQTALNTTVDRVISNQSQNAVINALYESVCIHFLSLFIYSIFIGFYQLLQNMLQKQ